MTTTVSQPAQVTVSFSKDGAEAPEKFRSELVEAAERVRGLLEERGIEVLLVNAANPDRSTEEALSGASGLMILGGADIDPSVYGQDLEADNLYYVDPAADRYEVGLVRAAAESGIPVFGICRGLQIINVAMGGTLIQDLGPGLHNQEVTGDPWTDHGVALAAGTRLRACIGQEDISVRTGHHQALDRMGDGLRVAARAADGVVEAAEGTDRWILGLQWHPEEAHGDTLTLGRLFDDYADAVRRRRAEAAPDSDLALRLGVA